MFTESNSARRMRSQILGFRCELAIRADEQELITDQFGEGASVARQLSAAQAGLERRHLGVWVTNKDRLH